MEMRKDIFQLQFENKQTLRNTTAKERIEKLIKLEKWILTNRESIKTAIYKDFKKSFDETELTEIYPVLSELRHAKRNLSKWMKSKRVKRTLTLITQKAYLKYEAKGNVLIISPWNYPFLLSIGPLVSSISAGNTAIIKPSEFTNHTSDLLEKMISELFSKSETAVVQGGKEISSELLELNFDHIFFTGSSEVGKIIAKSAAEKLTTITLELGGKSPVIVDETAHLRSSAEKIIWGKFLNKGQTCIAPDYVLVDKKIADQFSKLLIESIEKLYGTSIKNINSNGDYARIISEKHHNKLTEMLENALKNGSKILYGGKHNSNDKFIEPTLILSDCKNCGIAKDEIFGPLLPIIQYDEIDGAIDWINSRSCPLTIYIFSNNKKNIDKITSRTQTGSVGINELVVQFSHNYMPFGGVRNSGFGRSHGYFGFKEFSNERAYLKSGKINFLKIIYPPYTKSKKKIIDLMVRYF
ncbi:MAG: aldehyde dehydrogenase family protein [Ignavibacteriae bacterium]|nr:aldehyde dehydrogenase family protein [Ignavibacteriota bacterium]